MPLLPLALHLLYLAGDPWAMVGSGRSNLVCRPPLHSNNVSASSSRRHRMASHTAKRTALRTEAGGSLQQV